MAACASPSSAAARPAACRASAATGATATPRTRRTAAAAARCCWNATGPNGTTRVLIDTSPDMRDQLLDAGVGALDGVVYTHSHADHIHGIDDLRQIVFNMRRRLPVWADGPTQEALLPASAMPSSSPQDSPYPADPRPAHHRRPGVQHRRRRRRDRRCSPSASITAPSMRSASASAPSPICPTSWRSPTTAGRRLRAWTAGSSTRCAASRTRPMPISR